MARILRRPSRFRKKRTINESRLPFRITTLFHRSRRIAMTGDAVSHWPNGKKSMEKTFKAGLTEGTSTAWYENGNRRLESR